MRLSFSFRKNILSEFNLRAVKPSCLTVNVLSLHSIAAKCFPLYFASGFASFFLVLLSSSHNPMQYIPQYDDHELLTAIAGGDEIAFTRLFNAYHEKLYTFILRLTQSSETAEDVLQDVFFKIWTNRKLLKGIDNFNAYLFRIARNHAVNGLKRLSNRDSILARLAQTGQPDVEGPEDLLLKKEAAKQIRDAIDALPPQQKLVYTLSRIEGLKHGEIARQLNLSESTVKNHMVAALQNLRKQLSGINPDISFYYTIMLAILLRR